MSMLPDQYLDMLSHVSGQQEGRPLIKPGRFSQDEIKRLQALRPEALKQTLQERGKQSRNRANGHGLY